jgi:AI-2 transport protein TqsA
MTTGGPEGIGSNRAAVGSLVILAAVAVGLALYLMRPVLVPLTLALFVSYLVSPLVDWLQVRARLPRVLAVLAALLLAGGVFFLLGLLVVSSVSVLSDHGDVYQARLVGMIEDGVARLREWGVPLDDAPLRERLADLPVSSLLLGVLNQLLSSVSTLLLVLTFVIFLVAGRTPGPHKTGVWREIDERVNRYLLVKLATSAVTGLLTGGILALLGLDLSVVFGLLAFLLNFVPTVGGIASVLLPLPVALVQFGPSVTTVLVLAIPGAVQAVLGTVVEPKLAGKALELHPVTVLLSLVFWGVLWGLPGAFMAAPLMAVVKIVLDRIDATRAFGGLLAGHLPGVEGPPPAAPPG